MTRDEVQAKWDALTPRERDAWVAEAVMGWQWTYTSDIAAAWQVVEKMMEGEHNSFRLFRCDGFPESRRCAASFKPSVESALKLVEAPTAPEAICLAALMAVLA